MVLAHALKRILSPPLNVGFPRRGSALITDAHREHVKSKGRKTVTLPCDLSWAMRQFRTHGNA